jgi:aryl-alcohol dehydrogenase-like predicted oxidoreductase
VHPLSAVQIEYSLWSRDVEAEILPLCEELGIGFVAYSPLGRGFLTGKVADIAALRTGDTRRNMPRFVHRMPDRRGRSRGMLSGAPNYRRRAGDNPAPVAWSRRTQAPTRIF